MISISVRPTEPFELIMRLTRRIGFLLLSFFDTKGLLVLRSSVLLVLLEATMNKPSSYESGVTHGL